MCKAVRACKTCKYYQVNKHGLKMCINSRELHLACKNSYTLKGWEESDFSKFTRYRRKLRRAVQALKYCIAHMECDGTEFDIEPETELDTIRIARRALSVANDELNMREPSEYMKDADELYSNYNA